MSTGAAMRLTDCQDCGTLQRVPPMAGRNLLSCARCDAPIERTHGRDVGAALALSAATLLLLVPANLLPFLTTSILGVSRQSMLVTSASAMLSDGFPELAVVIGLFVVVLPPLRFALLTLVLGSLQIGVRPRWLGRAFRYACTLQTWAMIDVFLLGFLVAYARLATTISVEIGLGAWCFIAAAALSLLTRATLDPRAVWRAIGPEAMERPDAQDAASPAATAPTLACPACHLLLPAEFEGGDCPRCESRVHARKPEALSRAAAFSLAAAVLYVPANVYAIAALPIGLASVRYNVLEGALDLLHVGLYGLAILVLLASFVIPMLKLVALAWFIASVLRRSGRRLAAKTRLYRAVEEIGRWSMVDPFVIACFVPVSHYNAIVHGSAEPAAPAFAAVVILTTLAAHAFDPRLMWDAAEGRHTV